MLQNLFLISLLATNSGVSAQPEVPSVLTDIPPIVLPLPSTPRIQHSAQAMQGISFPAVFKITLQGTTEAGAFEPLEGTLEIQPAPPEDPNPFLVALYRAYLTSFIIGIRCSNLPN